MSFPITIAFRYLPGEMSRAIRALARRRFRSGHAAAPVTFLLGGSCVIFFGTAKYFWVGVMSVAIGLAWFFWLAVAFLIAPRMSTSPTLPEEYQWRFGPDGIFVGSSSFDTRLTWSHFKRASILEDFYLLHHAIGYSVIPKRAFASGSDARNFEALLAAQLPIEKQPNAKGA